MSVAIDGDVVVAVATHVGNAVPCCRNARSIVGTFAAPDRSKIARDRRQSIRMKRIFGGAMNERGSLLPRRRV
jgi:hypothetical protein